MAICERCWGDAHLRSVLNGTMQGDEYRKLLDERNELNEKIDEFTAKIEAGGKT